MTAPMKDKPILFSTPMVQAILDDRKIKTRRVIKGMGNKMHYDRLLGDWGLSDPPELIDGVLRWRLQTDVDDDRMFEVECPWKVGQTLWVRETWQQGESEYLYLEKMLRDGVIYTDLDDDPIKWKPSLFMPKDAARIFLKVKSIRVERLQDITEEDARAEGIKGIPRSRELSPMDDYIYPFKQLWDGLNSKRGYGWDVNPWVWVIEFERVEEPSNAP